MPRQLHRHVRTDGAAWMCAGAQPLSVDRCALRERTAWTCAGLASQSDEKVVYNCECPGLSGLTEHHGNYATQAPNGMA